MKKLILVLALVLVLGLLVVITASADKNGAVFLDSGHARMGMTYSWGKCAGINSVFMALDGFRRINTDGSIDLHISDQSVDLEVKRYSDGSSWSGSGSLSVKIKDLYGDRIGTFSARGNVTNDDTGELAKVVCHVDMNDDVWFIKLK